MSLNLRRKVTKKIIKSDFETDLLAFIKHLVQTLDNTK